MCGSALVLSACDGDDDEEVAFGGECIWQLDDLPPEEGDPEGSVRLAIDAVCDYSDTGFGELEGVGTAFISAPDLEGDVVITSDIVYTDDDGDTIEGELDGVGNYSIEGLQVTFNGEEDFGNGTGGFAGAVGSVDAEGLLDLETDTGTYDTEGTIILVDD